MAHDLGIARSTVVGAYEQLAVEGYLVARQGGSTVVAQIAIPAQAIVDRNPMGDQPTHDFRPGEPALGSFPRREWLRSVRTVLLESADDAFGYGDPRGRRELRDALADYLARSRMVHVDSSAVRVHGGFASSLGFVAEMFRRRGIDLIAVEAPMLFFHRQILELAGLETVPVPVDEHGLRVDDLGASGVRAVLVTPGNQQPLGVTMSSARRNALITWAAVNDGWIVEDGYDGEFRYDRRPIGALQGLDADRALYAGTASKSMGPGLHLSWFVVPLELRRDLDAVTHLRGGVSTIDQLALADFIGRGAYDRQVRLQRRIYRQRRSVMLEQLRGVPWLDVAPGSAGLHLVGHHRPGLVINVSRPANHHFATATEKLLAVLREVG